MNENYTSDLPEEDGIKLLDVLQILAENARLLIFGPIIVALLALGWSFLSTPSYMATTTIMTPQQSQGGAAAALAQLSALAGMAGMGGAGSAPGSAAATHIGLLNSRSVADRMVDRFALMKAKKVKTREDAREILERITRVTPRKDGLITIAVVTFNPKLSAAMANTYVEELSLLSDRLAVTEAQKRRQFLEKELTKVKENLAKAEVALGGAGISENTLKFNPVTMGQGIATLTAQIMAKELQLTSMRGYLTVNSPSFRLARQELAALRAQLGKYENTQPAGDNAEYVNRYREFKYQEVLFEQLSKQYELAKLDELRDGLIQVVDVAVPPTRKSNLHKGIIVSVAWLAAGLVLLIFVFVRHALKRADQDPDNARKLAAIRAGFGRVFKPWRRYAAPVTPPAD